MQTNTKNTNKTSNKQIGTKTNLGCCLCWNRSGHYNMEIWT